MTALGFEPPSNTVCAKFLISFQWDHTNTHEHGLCLVQTAHRKPHPLELLLALNNWAADSAQNILLHQKGHRIPREEAVHPMQQHQVPWATSSRLQALKARLCRPALQEQFALESRILCQITCKLMDNFPTSTLPGAYKLETAICCELEWNAVFQEWSKVLQKMFLTYNAVRTVYINLPSAPVFPLEILLLENLS